MAVPIVMPKLGMVMSEGTISKWAKSPGERVNQGDVVAEIETEKINYDLEATADGIFHPIVSEGAIVPVDGLLGYVLAAGEAMPEPQAAPEVAQPAGVIRREPKRDSSRSRPSGAAVRSTPGARRQAIKLGVDIEEVIPTGPGGRVVEGDVRAYFEQKPPVIVPSIPSGLPDPSETIHLKGMRKVVADHMRDSLARTAQLTFHLEVDVTEAQRQRKKTSAGSNATLTIANVLVKACGEALRRHPEHNSVLSEGRILHFDEVNIAIAVALSEGLIVPVIRQVDRKSIFDISRETQELVAKAKDGSLLPDDLAGGTFTISVLGSVDGFTPILNAGQTAILGVGRSLKKPVVRERKVVVREMMSLSLTVDHQVIDGAVAASFLRRLQQIVERPGGLFK